jgi:glycosyltransferase involved in cell wall biosynthesis
MFFSVVVPLFNKAELVVDTVRSILAQEFSDLEVIVIDDGSTDGSVHRLALIIDPRLKVFRQPNGGVSTARNAGIEKASGKFISFLDADDIWAADHLSQIKELIDIDPSAVAWATGYSEMDQTQGAEGPMQNAPHAAAVSGCYGQRDFMVAWSRFPFFWTGSITVRSSTLRSMQPCFPPGEALGEDQDLWFRLSELGEIRFNDIRTTAFYRRNVSDSLTTERVFVPLPVFLRLGHRASVMSLNEKKAARQLCGIHLLHVAWNNCLAGRRMTTLRLLLQVNIGVRWSYWIRIFVCSLLPVGLVRNGLILIRRPRVG